MIYIEKQILSTPYYVPLNVHKLVAYTVDIVNNVVTATVASYFSKEALSQADAQPLAQYAVVMHRNGANVDEDWVAEQIVQGGSEVPNAYNYQGYHQLANRNFLMGGEMKRVVVEEAHEVFDPLAEPSSV